MRPRLPSEVLWQIRSHSVIKMIQIILHLCFYAVKRSLIAVVLLCQANSHKLFYFFFPIRALSQMGLFFFLAMFCSAMLAQRHRECPNNRIQLIFLDKMKPYFSSALPIFQEEYLKGDVWHFSTKAPSLSVFHNCSCVEVWTLGMFSSWRLGGILFPNTIIVGSVTLLSSLYQRNIS